MSNDPLSKLAMWTNWQQTVISALPNYAADMIYVAQNSTSEEEYERVVKSLGSRLKPNPEGQVRDIAHGARVIQSTTIGTHTRMWLDSQVEIDFIQRNYPKALTDLRVFDIGAGYGRLAAEMSPLVKSYCTVDPVPISVRLCSEYCAKYAPAVKVMSVGNYREDKASMVGQIDLAINVHSWNECTYSQIEQWLNELRDLRVKCVFTVSHGHIGNKEMPPYMTWDGNGKSWRSLMTREFDLIAEESIGVDCHPHALWVRQNTNL